MNRREFIKNLKLFGLGLSFCTTPISLFSNNLAPYYPPFFRGIRGSHDSAFKYAHQIAFDNRSFKTDIKLDTEYDLIVVGAGISGLSSAFFYLQKINPKAKILILDNHDDFGGHAKRNEFIVDGEILLSYGGTQSFDTISEYSNITNNLLEDLGIDLSKFENYYDKEFFSKYDLSSGIFYDEDNYLENKIVKSTLPSNTSFESFSDGYMPYLKKPSSFKDTIKDIPLSQKDKGNLYKILESHESVDDYDDLSYVEFLKEAFDIKNKALLELLSNVMIEDMALGGDTLSVEEASYGGLLGVSKAFVSSLSEFLNSDKYIYHFPDGNATLARMLVKKLIPSVANFDSVERCVSAKYDYAKLDTKVNQVNIRLNSTVSSIKNDKNKTIVEYIKDDKVYEIKAKHTIMAGWHSMASYIINDIPKEQKKLLKENTKMPLVYVQVALKNWEFIKKAGVATNYCPSSYFQFVNIDFPINIGSYRAIKEPNKPIVLTMIRVPTPKAINNDIKEILKQGRYELLGTSYDDFKNSIKKQLTKMYSKYGFEYEKDVADIVINRWSHGYTYEGSLSKKELKKATKSFGNIYFANSDSNGSAYTDAAIDMAYKAISEIKNNI
jgi:spermidine dehydrogenase